MIKKQNLSSIADKCLKAMYNAYQVEHIDHFDMNFFRNIFPGQNDNHITDALLLLKSNGYASVFIADSTVYMTTILPNGIKHIESNSLFSKIYKFIKEIVSWF